MAEEIRLGDSPESLAQRMLGDSRLVRELQIPGWQQGMPLPVGAKAYLREEGVGPPSRNWTQPRKEG